MASRNPNRSARPAYPAAVRAAASASPPEVVDPGWLVKALGVTLAVAIVLGYLSVCLLVYQGGWQFLLHPSSKVEAMPTAPLERIAFDAAATGRPRLTGWWIPAASHADAAPTLLFLHGGDGSLSTSISTLDELHGTNANVFAIDYRGYGQSEGPHPTEARMQEDAGAALDYLVSTRHLNSARIVPYGQGLGAVLAANLAAAHPELRAVALDTPDPLAFGRVTSTGQARLLPMRLLVQEHFDLTQALAGTRQARLLVVQNPVVASSSDRQRTENLFRSAAEPKMIVSLHTGDSAPTYLALLSRFLEEYVPAEKH